MDTLVDPRAVRYLGRHYGGLEIFCPYPGGPVAHGHEVLVLGRVALDAVDRTVVLSRPHVKDADTIVLLPVPQVDLRKFRVSVD